MYPVPKIIKRSALVCAILLASQWSVASRAGEGAAVLEEIIVTANKREQSLQDVASAVTGFNAEYINEAGINNLMSITALTPGFSMSSFSLGQPQLYIRGIGSNEDGAGGDPSVASYIDGIYVARASGSSFNFLDVERIEVLRGPQGTLYGKNAIGGVVNVISAQPHDSLAGKAELVAGEYDLREFRGRLNLPLANRLYANMAVTYRERDGYVDNKFTGDEQQDIDDIAAHGQLLYEPTDTFDITLGFEWEDVDRNGNGRHTKGPVLGALHDNDVFTTQSDMPGHQKREVHAARIEMNWSTGLGLLTSLSGYRDTEYSWQENLFGLPQGVATQLLNSTHEEAKQYSQELRLMSDNDDSDTEWTAGLYYLHEDVDRMEVFNIDTGFAFHEQFDQENTTDSAAVFGEYRRPLNDRFSATLGLRYTYEKKDFKNSTSADPFPIFFFREEFSIHEDENWDKLTWRLVGEYELESDGMIYASISKGFKSGGFQGQPSESISAATSFDPEEAINYELGLKSQWLDNRLRLNVAAYYMDYSDLQILQFQQVGVTPEGIPIGAGVVENAADATTKGVEVEMHWAVTPYFQLFGFYAYNDTEFDNFHSDGKDLSGNQLRNAPENSYAINARYSLPLANGSEISSLLIYSYRDETYQSNENFDTNKFDDKELLEARISWRSPMDAWELSVWGKNLTDETYQIHRIAGPDEGTETASIYGIPRHYGGTISYQF